METSPTLPDRIRLIACVGTGSRGATGGEAARGAAAYRRVRAGRCRPIRGFSLLEVVLSLAILGGSMAVLGEAVRLAMENARVARDLTDAQLYCESKMAELEAGILTTDAVTDTPIESMADSALESSSLSQETGWLYSIENELVDDQGLVLVRLTVCQDPAKVKKPVSFTMTRMFLDETMISTDSSTSESTDSSTSTSSQETES